MKPQLISFKLCPFVQRSVIVLQEKGVDYDIEYIDINNPPDWFKAISPLGKVPVLRVGEAVVFESAVIMEYLDEVNPPSLHPAEPLRKAQNRAWMEFASSLFMSLYGLVSAEHEADYQAAESALRAKLTQLDAQLSGPYFNGEQFNLIDAAYAPLLMRLALLEEWAPMGLYDGLNRLPAWSAAVLGRPAVQDSVIPEFAELYRRSIGNRDGYAAERFDPL
ncbi:MAG: glutathione S-transferase family protein [Thiohalomonadaceae bacterium]